MVTFTQGTRTRARVLVLMAPHAVPPICSVVPALLTTPAPPPLFSRPPRPSLRVGRDFHQCFLYRPRRGERIRYQVSHSVPKRGKFLHRRFKRVLESCPQPAGLGARFLMEVGGFRGFVCVRATIASTVCGSRNCREPLLNP